MNNFMPYISSDGSGTVLGNYATLYRLSSRVEVVVGVVNALVGKDYINIDGEKVEVAVGAYSIRTINTINSDGLDSGSVPAHSTMYYVYHSNDKEVLLPRKVRLCLTQNGADGYLPSNHNWRLIGAVYISYQSGTILHSYTSMSGVNNSITGTELSSNFISSSGAGNSFITFPDPQSNGETDLPLTLLPGQSCKISVQQKHYLTGSKSFGVKITLDGVDQDVVTSNAVWNATPNMYVETYVKNVSAVPTSQILRIHYYYTSGTFTMYKKSRWRVERWF